MKIIDQRGEWSRTIGMYHGNPIYWSDLMRIAPDHRTPKLASMLWRIGQKVLNLGYRVNKRAARREMNRWGIDHPFALDAKGTEE